MILDSSAIVAIFLQEPGHEEIRAIINSGGEVGVGAPTLVECAIVLTARLGSDSRGMLARFVEEASVTIIPFTEQHFGLAVGAWMRFGKGRHPAGLNFGDCLAYAVARLANMPLICVGEDFLQTDLTIA
jgi:ribonuclease VapC